MPALWQCPGAGWSLLHAVVLGIFAISWLMRREEPAQPSATAAVLGALALLAAGVSAWLGGELIYRLSVGVEPGAHPDASSSLAEAPGEKRP